MKTSGAKTTCNHNYLQVELLAELDCEDVEGRNPMGVETSTPVTAGQFFDRQIPLERLERLLSDAASGTRRWLALMGHRKIGKTSLLLELIRRRADKAPMAYVDCWEIRSDPVRFLAGVVFTLIRTMLRHRGDEARLPPLQPSTDGRIDRALVQELARLDSPALDKAVRLHDRLLSQDLTVSHIRSVFELPQAMAEQMGVPLVVVLDEFQEVDRLRQLKRIKGGLGDVFGVLRSLWQQQVGVSYLVAGSQVTLLRRILTDEDSPFYQHIEMMELGTFPREESLRMLGEVLCIDEDLSESVAIGRILDVLGDHPFYIRALVPEIGFPLPRREPRLPDLEVLLKAALQVSLFDQNGRLSLFMEQRYRSLVKNSTTTESVLRGFVEPARVSDVAEKLRIRTGAVSSAVKTLMAQDALAKLPDGRYAFTDPAFAVWLQHQVDFRRATPPLLVGTDAEQAVARRLAADGFRSVYQARASRGAFDLLAVHDVRVFGVQVKKRELPYRLPGAELTRLIEEGTRLGFHPVLALVTSTGVRFYELKKKHADGLPFNARKKHAHSLLELL